MDTHYITTRPGYCHCGCGTQTAKNRRFRQGHDARFKGVLMRAHVAGTTITLVHHITKDEVQMSAMDVANTYGWGKYLEDAAMRAATKQIKSDLKRGAGLRYVTDVKTGEKYALQLSYDFKIAGGRTVSARCTLISGGKATFTYKNSKGEEKNIVRKVEG